MAKLKKKIKRRKTVFSTSKIKDDFDDFDHEDNDLIIRKDVFKKNYGYNLQDKLVDPIFDAHTNVLLKKMRGDEFTVKYCQETGFVHPIFFEKPDGLGLKMPRDKFGVKSVQKLLGEDRILDVMEVGTQKGLQMTMKKFLSYYKKPPEKRKQLLNVLSLEFSNTKLEKIVQGPKIVKELDWVELAWPKDLRQAQVDGTNAMISMKYPKVQNYCLMSVGGCYTDFHVDFGGTSVWYHVLKGEKVFWLAPPTDENLQRYQDWTLTGQQQKIFLGDLVEHCIRIHLKAGNTFMIPSGWIHAVYTPIDSLVFGGNFLHCFAVPIQLRVHQLEINTRVPKKFRYPFFHEMQWFLAERYFYAFTGISYLKKLPTPENQIKSEPVPELVDDLSSSAVKTAPNDYDADAKNSDEPKEMVEHANVSVPNVEKTVSDDFLPLYSPENLRKLTQFELEGLKCLIKWLNLPDSKRHAPERLRDAELMLLNLKETINGVHVVDDPPNLEGRTIINPVAVKRRMPICAEIVEKRRKIIKKEDINTVLTKNEQKNDTVSTGFRPKMSLASFESIQNTLPATKVLNFNSNLFASGPKMNFVDDLQRPSCSKTSQPETLPYDLQQNSRVNLPSMTVFQRSPLSFTEAKPVNQFQCVLPLISSAGQSSSTFAFVDLTPLRSSQQRPTMKPQEPANQTKNIRYLSTTEIYPTVGQTSHRPAILRTAPVSHCLNFNTQIGGGVSSDFQVVRQTTSAASNLQTCSSSMPGHRLRYTAIQQTRPRQTEFIFRPNTTASFRPASISLPVNQIRNLHQVQMTSQRSTVTPEYRVLVLPTEKNLNVRQLDSISSSGTSTPANLYRSLDQAADQQSSLIVHSSSTVPVERTVTIRSEPNCVPTPTTASNVGGSSIFALNELVHRF